MNSNTTLVKVKLIGGWSINSLTVIIQIQHLLKLNFIYLVIMDLFPTIQIQHLLKLNLV